MIPAAQKHLPYLDGWRGLAICLLLAGHFFPVRGMNLGALGVNFFFVLSGLLMARILFVDALPLLTFYRRRIARIFPLAYAFLALVLLWYVFTGLPVEWNQFLAALAFVNNYIPVSSSMTPMPIGHFWSLCVEEHMYVLLGLLALGARARWFKARTALGILVLCSLAIGSIYRLTYTGPDLYHERWLRSEVAGFGILISAFLLLHLKDWRASSTVHPFILVLLLGIGILAHWWRFDPWTRSFIGVTALAAAVNLLERSPAWVRKLASVTPLRILGTWSFSIYVWQQPFYLLAGAGKIHPLAGAAAALATGILSYYLLERPVRAFLNRRIHQARPHNPMRLNAAHPQCGREHATRRSG